MLVQRLRRTSTRRSRFRSAGVGIVVRTFSLQRWRPFPARAPIETALDAGLRSARLGLGPPVRVPAGPALPAARATARGRWRTCAHRCALHPCFAFFCRADAVPRPIGFRGCGLRWLVGVDPLDAFVAARRARDLLGLYGRVRSAPTSPSRAPRRGALSRSGALHLYGRSDHQHWIADLPPAFLLAFSPTVLLGMPRALSSSPARRSRSILTGRLCDSCPSRLARGLKVEAAVGIRVRVPRRMSARDAGFLYLERSHTQLHIGCVAILDGRLRREELIGRIEERLPRLRRYGQRAMRVPLSLGHPSWEDDPGFRVEHHVTRWGLPAPGGEGELREAVARLFTGPLDRERPLWEMHVIEGLAEGDGDVQKVTTHDRRHAGAQLLGAARRDRPAPRGEHAVRPESELPDRAAFARALGDGSPRVRAAWPGLARALAAARRVGRMRRLRDAAFSRPLRRARCRSCRGTRRSAAPRVAFTKLRYRGRAPRGARREPQRRGAAVLKAGSSASSRRTGRENARPRDDGARAGDLRSPGEAGSWHRISASWCRSRRPAAWVPRLAPSAPPPRAKTSGAWTGITRCSSCGGSRTEGRLSGTPSLGGTRK